MYNHHLHGYRKLTTDEQAMAKRAIDWLAAKRLRSNHIALLTTKNLERETKTLAVSIEKGRLIFFRRIHYADTPFDLYITEVLPYLKVEKWLFPNQGWTGVKPSFGFHVHTEDVENYLQNRHKRVLVFQQKYSKIDTSAKNMNITKQIMVGRRIALRA